MPRKSKLNIAVLVVFMCLLAVFGVKAYMNSSNMGLSSSTQTKLKGTKDAALKITEFIDFQCPACAQGAKYLKETMEQHPNLIQLELKHFPLQMHAHGMVSAQYAECASAQGKFWPLHDLLLARQNNWKRLIDPQPAFDQMVKEAKIDVPQMNACFKSGKALKVIDKNKLEGSSLGVRSTPTYFVNGKMVVGMKSLQLEIDKHLQDDAN